MSSAGTFDAIMAETHADHHWEITPTRSSGQTGQSRGTGSTSAAARTAEAYRRTRSDSSDSEYEYALKCPICVVQ